jgi:predicted PurR-regulated permease PerM
VLGVFGWSVPYIIVLGLFTFVLNFIPMVGATIGAIPAIAVVFFTNGAWAAAVVTAFIVVYQQLENSIIQPRIQGKVVNLPPIAIFFSVFIGSNIFGVIGALFAVPVASVIAIILDHWFAHTGRMSIEPPRLFDENGYVIRRGADLEAEAPPLPDPPTAAG